MAGMPSAASRFLPANVPKVRLVKKPRESFTTIGVADLQHVVIGARQRLREVSALDISTSSSGPLAKKCRRRIFPDAPKPSPGR
jgi:hypothetical protein